MVFSTPHFCAAASTSISRAAAPALRMGSQDERTLELPPVPCIPNAGLKYSLAAGANSVRIFFQSHSSSSAASMQSAVWMPWPISDLSIMIVTLSSAPMRIQAFSAAGAAVPAGAAASASKRPGK